MVERPIILKADEVRELLTGRVVIEREIKSLRGQPACNVRVDPDDHDQWQQYGAGGVWMDLNCLHGRPGQRLMAHDVGNRELPKSALFATGDCYPAENVGVEVVQVDGVWTWRTTLARMEA